MRKGNVVRIKDLRGGDEIFIAEGLIIDVFTSVSGVYQIVLDTGYIIIIASDRLEWEG